MTSHQKFPSIESFDRLYGRETWEGLEMRRILALRPKVKIHGENVAIRHFSTPEGTTEVRAQGRNGDLAEDSKTKARLFRTRVQEGAEVLNPSMYGWLDARGMRGTTVTVYGEWAGPGVKKGPEVSSKIPQKAFFPFAALVGEVDIDEDGRRTGGIIITRPDELEVLCQEFYYILDLPVHVVPFATDAVTLDFTSDADLASATGMVNAMVEGIDKIDPFIKSLYDIEGPGEGFVFMPEVGFDDAMPYEIFEKLCFKAKTSSHQVRSQEKPAQARIETPASVLELISQFCTEARFQQGLEEACGGTADRKGTGAFLGWMKSDIHKEAAPEIATLDVDRKIIDAEIAKASRVWFLQQVEMEACAS
jgi:hypothetical protein